MTIVRRGGGGSEALSWERLKRFVRSTQRKKATQGQDWPGRRERLDIVVYKPTKKFNVKLTSLF